MVMDSEAVAVAATLSVTLKTMAPLAPVLVGVPLITPVLASKANPLGRLPDEIDHV